MKRLKNILLTLYIGLLFIVGIGVLVYPSFSNWWNGRMQSRAVASYNEAVDNLSKTDYASMLEIAEKYNKILRQVGTYDAMCYPERIPGYEDTLNVNGTGIMGTITIDKIGVNLPIYHGTSTGVLSSGAGHLEGTSLPIGGKGNHSVISAHRGLPSSKFFTDLDRLNIGDVFVLHVAGNDLVYQIDQIVTVLPSEVEELYLKEGEDYCTLMTCTPYGINTHRLLLRGHRAYLTPKDEAELGEVVSAENSSRSLWRIIQTVITVAAVIIVVLILSEIFVRIMRRRK